MNATQAMQESIRKQMSDIEMYINISQGDCEALILDDFLHDDVIKHFTDLGYLFSRRQNSLFISWGIQSEKIIMMTKKPWWQKVIDGDWAYMGVKIINAPI